MLSVKVKNVFLFGFCKIETWAKKQKKNGLIEGIKNTQQI